MDRFTFASVFCRNIAMKQTISDFPSNFPCLVTLYLYYVIQAVCTCCVVLQLMHYWTLITHSFSSAMKPGEIKIGLVQLVSASGAIFTIGNQYGFAKVTRIGVARLESSLPIISFFVSLRCGCRATINL